MRRLEVPDKLKEKSVKGFTYPWEQCKLIKMKIGQLQTFILGSDGFQSNCCCHMENLLLCQYFQSLATCNPKCF